MSTVELYELKLQACKIIFPELPRTKIFPFQYGIYSSINTALKMKNLQKQQGKVWGGGGGAQILVKTITNFRPDFIKRNCNTLNF
jgi:hypothetical protein